MITAERARELLEYEPTTGEFVWRYGRPNASAGTRVGWLSKGYLMLTLDRKKYRAHRIAWLYVHGRWPVDEIDHINGDICDNRISNLREASHSQNMMNRHAYRRSKSGFKGVYFHKSWGKWIAEISKEGNRVRVGGFATPEEAYDAYCAVAQEKHGEFFRGRQ